MADEDVQSDIPTRRMQSWAKNSTIYRLGRQMMTEKQLFDAISRKAKQKFEGISHGADQGLGRSGG
jgi:regulatory protein